METNLGLFIAIFTFNRQDLLKKMSESLAMVKGITEESVFVFDDSSREYGDEFLREIFPYAESIIIRNINVGADANVHSAMLDFLETKKDYMVILDSDLLFDSDIINFIKTSIPITKGFFSVYNSCIHESKGKVQIGDSQFLAKRTVGAAGMVISRELVGFIINEIPLTRKFDWDICSYLNGQNIPILVSEKSYAQHIGFSGYNNSYLTKYEYAINFIPNNEITQRHLLTSIEKLIILENSRKSILARVTDCIKLTKRFLSIRLKQFLSYIRGGRQ
jgi:hypothetical protein